MSEEEILEKLVERCKECKFACCEQCEINWKEVQAIENLIQENKELKERNKYLPGWVSRKYISKDKVKELLEHYKDTGYYVLEEVLQELLEERN